MGSMPLAVIEWLAWKRFLISFVDLRARRIPILPGARLMDSGRSLSNAQKILLHVNVTCQGRFFSDRDAFRRWASGQGIVLLNDRVESTDKWSLQEKCAHHGLASARASLNGDPDEILVVKTRANHCGRPERRLEDKYLGDMQRIEHWPFASRIELAPRRRIAPNIWNHSGLTVERYVGNSAGQFHRAYVLGDYVAAATSQCAGVLKEMDHRTKHSFCSTFDGASLEPSNTEVLSVAYRCARSLSADFAAIDIAEDESGTLYPIDLNVTPWWGDDSNERLIRELRQALNSFDRQ